MLYNGIGFNLEWAKAHTQAEFVEQHIDAFKHTDHPISKMNKADREKWLKQAYNSLVGLVNKGKP
ncbi:hypothetical protein Pan5_11 [Pseudanabaena phage Pan5]|nr:hypothetical protein Pan5_11 [Pseudanabaena phage Pan5]